MANVRCPMCSKVNPPDAEACAFCGARLKPHTSSSASPQGPASGEPAGKSGGDEPDWLRQIRQDSPGSTVSGTPLEGLEQEGAQPGEEDKDVPNWLARIRERSREEVVEEGSEELAETLPSSFSSAEALDQPEWMRDLKEETPQQESQAVDKNDWMSQFAAWESGGDEDAAKTDLPAPSAPAAASDEDLSWLASFGQEKEQPASEESQPEPALGRASSGFGLTGFLSSLEEEPEENAPQAEEPSQEPSPWGVPANIDRIEPSTTTDEATTGETAAPADDLPAWLSGMAPATAPEEALFPVETAQPAESLFAETDDGDWLQRFNRPSPQELVPSPAASFEASEDEAPGVPDWLQGGSFGAEQTPAAAGEDDLPDWLSSNFGAESPVETPSGGEALFGEEQQVLEAGPVEEAGFDSSDAGLPAWLINEEEPLAQSPQAVQDEGSAAQETEQPEQPLTGQPEMAAETKEGLPEWFSDLGLTDEEAPSEHPVEDTQPTWLYGISTLESAEKETAAEQAVEQVPQSIGSEAGSEPFIDENVPEWLRDFNSRQPSSENSSIPALIEMDAVSDAASNMDADQPFSVDLPDWLSEDSTLAPVDTGELPAEPAGEELVRADLPEWVKDMRPIESVLGSESSSVESDQRVEKAGPLAGMRGVLPAEELVTHYRKLPVYSVKLRVTEKQRSHGSLLDTILSQETQALALPPQRSHTPRLILRILVALILLSVMLLPRLLQLDPLVLPLAAPGLAPDEMQDMFDSIEGSVSQESAPVLLAVDYEPGLSGEMHLSAAPVVAHLMARNARIVVLSTVPSGPALAQRLLQDAAADQENYELDQRTINLGYLPGGTISLLEFARQPQLAAPVTLSGDFAWDHPAVSGISGLQSFSQIIVLTDSPETGRAWVEQVQPFMGDVPLLMVSSAQAAPMLEPYVQSGQVQGMVSGMLGGMMYGQQTGIANNPAAAHFASYQFGVLLAFGLVLTGGIISGGRALLRRRTKDEE